MEKLKKLYEDLYQNGYHNNFGFTHSKNLIDNGIKKYLKSNSKILDVGCSSGTAMSILEKNNYTVSGVDISETAIKLSSKNGLKDVKVSQTHEIDYPNDFFDGILCTDVLEHVHKNNIEKTFLEFKRITKKDAFFFLKIALIEEKNRRFDEITKKHGFDHLHILVEDKNYWLNLFKKHNLKVIKIINENTGTLEIILSK